MKRAGGWRAGRLPPPGTNPGAPGPSRGAARGTLGRSPGRGDPPPAQGLQAGEGGTGFRWQPPSSRTLNGPGTGCTVHRADRQTPVVSGRKERRCISSSSQHAGTGRQQAGTASARLRHGTASTAPPALQRGHGTHPGHGTDPVQTRCQRLRQGASSSTAVGGGNEEPELPRACLPFLLLLRGASRGWGKGAAVRAYAPRRQFSSEENNLKK